MCYCFQVICFTSSIATESIEPENGADSAIYGDTVTFKCRSGFNGTSVTYNCSAFGMFEPVDNFDSINCIKGNHK